MLKQLMLEEHQTSEFLAEAVRYSSPVEVLMTQVDRSVSREI